MLSFARIIGIAVGFALFATSPALAKPKKPQFAVGQRWEYESLPQDKGSTLLIVKMDEVDGGIIFVDIENLMIDGSPSTISFAPVTRRALKRSVTRLTGEFDDNPTFLPMAYERWGEAIDQGVPFYFDTHLKEVIAKLAPMATANPTPPEAPPRESAELAEQKERFARAVGIAEEGRFVEALEMIDVLLEECVGSVPCVQWRHDRDYLYGVADKEQRDLYNQAASWTNSKEYALALEILVQMDGNVVDDELAKMVRDNRKMLEEWIASQGE